MGLTTLKRRAEFLRVRGGLRWSTPTLVLEAKPRGRDETAAQEPQGARFGYTVSKKVGKAVVRNRIRRQLKAATRELMENALPGYDYVIIARPAAAGRRYAELRSDLTQALTRVSRAAAARRPM